MAVAKKKYFHISSLEKGLKVMELLAEQKEFTVTRAAEMLGLNRTASHRYLSTLRELGYVEKNNNNRYQLTHKVFEIGMKVANRFEILRVAFAHMQELSSIYNETINLGCLDGINIIHLDKIESGELLRIDPSVGNHAPAYCTALGKAILAYLHNEEFEAFIDSVSLKSFTPKTITSKKKLERELKEVRINGVAVDNEELCIGLRCVGAPIFDSNGYPRYSMSISGPTSRMPTERMKKMKKDVRRVCDKLSSKWESYRRPV